MSDGDGRNGSELDEIGRDGERMSRNLVEWRVIANEYRQRGRLGDFGWFTTIVSF